MVPLKISIAGGEIILYILLFLLYCCIILQRGSIQNRDICWTWLKTTNGFILLSSLIFFVLLS